MKNNKSNYYHNPNFKYKEKLELINDDLFEINNAFDVYTLLNDESKVYLAGTDNYNLFTLDIFIFNITFQKILNIKYHKGRISSCSYFRNNKKEYLISANIDQRPVIIIWSILSEKNYSNIFEINNITNKLFILPYTMLFIDDDKSYFIYPTTLVVSCLSSIEQKKKIKSIKSTNGRILFYIIWENCKDGIKYIIQCSENYIYIYNPFDVKNEHYAEINDNYCKGSNYSACIIYNKNNTDLLCISNEEHKVIFYDLFMKKINKIINTNENKLRNISKINDRYLVVLSKGGCLILIDSDCKKIICKYKDKNLGEIKTFKKFKDKNNVEYFLISGFMTGISVYINQYNFNIQI